MKTLLFLIGSLAWAQGNVPAIGYTVGGAGSVASPTDSPGTGTYTTSQAVTLSDSTSGSTICYTTNGTSPAAATPGTCSAGSTYSTPFTLSVTATVKALGTKVALTNSSVATLGVYTIQNAAPTDANSGGSCTGSSPTWTCTGTTTVTLASATGGSTICYTVDGSTPAAATPGTCSAGTTYSGTISVAATTTIKALATKTGLTNSGVLTSTYTVSGGGGPAFVSPNTAGSCSLTGSPSACTLTSINTTSADAVFVGLSSRGADLATCITNVASVIGGGSDTFSLISSGVSGGHCALIFAKYHATSNASYPIVITMTGGSGLFGFAYTIGRFSMGSLTGTTDVTCSGSSGGATAISCSGSMTPAGTNKIGVALVGAYDATGAGTDNSSPSSTFVIPTGGTAVVGGIGSVAFSYFINPTTAAVTPGFTGVGAGDPIQVVGVFVK